MEKHLPREKNIKNEYETAVPVFSEGTSVDLEILSSQNNDDDDDDNTVKNITVNIPEDISNSENKHKRFDALKTRNSLYLTAATIPEELVNISLQIKFMAIIMARINQSNFDMDKYLDLILQLSKKNEELSKMINDENQKAITSEKDAYLKESSAYK
jgi:hypothetical protein